MLVMQAKKGVLGCGYNAYGSKPYGSLTPNYIYHQGEKYEIDEFHSKYFEERTDLFFKNNKSPNCEKIIIEVNSTIYTFVKPTGSVPYTITERIFTEAATYTIKILSIE